MTPSLPMCCSPAAFKLLSRQVKVIDSPDALLEAAIAISMHQVENVDPNAVDTQMQF